VPNREESTCKRTVQQIFAEKKFEGSRAQKHRASCLAGAKMTGMSKALFCS